MKLFIFGSTGDLIKRKILLALQSLDLKELEIWAIGRRDLADESYIKFICSEKCKPSLKEKLHYLKMDFQKQDIFDGHEHNLDVNKINYFYIAMPPNTYHKIIISLAKLKEKGFKIRILLEKPFGSNLEEARSLKKTIHENNLTEDIFLSDHYLFKEEILNLKETNFKKVKLTSIEKVGLSNRVTYYDNTGALNDMVQSHFFNIIFRLLKYPNKLKSLKVIKYIRGQYGDGISKGYVKELGKMSQTETFVYLKIKADQKDFILITGKGFNKKHNQLEIDKKIIPIKVGKSYNIVFSKFFLGKKQSFPTIDDAILSWELIKKINSKKPGLIYYKKGSFLNDLITGEN